MEMTCVEAQRLQVPCKLATWPKESTVPAVCLMTFRDSENFPEAGSGPKGLMQMLFRRQLEPCCCRSQQTRYEPGRHNRF